MVQNNICTFFCVFEIFFVYIAWGLSERAFQLGTKTSITHLELCLEFLLKGMRDKNFLSRKHLDGLFLFCFFLLLAFNVWIALVVYSYLYSHIKKFCVLDTYAERFNVV